MWDAPADVIEVLWFDPELPARLQKDRWYKRLLTAHDRRQPPRSTQAGLSAEKRAELKEKRGIAGLLGLRNTVDSYGIEGAVQEAMSQGTFVPPLVLAAGLLDFPFDEVQALKVTVGAVSTPRPFRPITTGWPSCTSASNGSGQF